MLPADLTYRERAPLQRRSGIPCFVTITKCHELSSVSGLVLCSKRLMYVDLVLPGTTY